MDNFITKVNIDCGKNMTFVNIWFCMKTISCLLWKEENVLLDNTFNTFYLWSYDNGNMVKNLSDSDHRDVFICTIPQTG